MNSDPNWVVDNVTLTAVPEPASFALCGVAAAGLWLRRRKARAAGTLPVDAP